MNGKFLPIGSVVLLKKASKKLMIIGYAAKTEESDEVYDYSACMYPEGLLSSSQICVFHASQIEKVFCVGYSDAEQKAFIEKIKETK